MDQAGWLNEMLYSLDSLKKERRTRGSSRICGGGTVGYRGVGMMALVRLDPCGLQRKGSYCLRCCYSRRRQRLLAFLTASTSISFLLLLLHTPSILLPQREVLPAERELPERSHYVKKDVHLLGEAKQANEIHGEVFRPAVYRNRYYDRKIHNDNKHRVKHRVSSDDILKNYKSGDDIVHIKYIKKLPQQKQKSFERKLNLLELRSYKSREGGGGGGREGSRSEDEVDEEDKGEIGKRDTWKVLRGRSRGIDSSGKTRLIETSKNKTREVLSYPPSETPKLSLGRRENGRTQEDSEESVLFLVVFDYKRPPYFPWKTTRDECTNYATRFLVAGGAPLIAAVSFPGSGNTWLRYITETLTGIFTGSVYHDEALALKGFWGERDGYRQGTTVLQKTHSFPLLPHEVRDGIYNGNEFRFLLPSEPRKVIILLRNPWESLLALRHYHAAGHTGSANTAFFQGPGWANFTSERAHLWVKLYTAWLSLPRTKLHVVHYEHLQHNIEKEAKRLIQFLGLPLDYGRLECLIRYPEGHFRRPKYSKHLQGYQFPAASVNILKEGMRSIDSLLSQGRHPSLPKHLYSFTPRSIDRAIPRPNR